MTVVDAHVHVYPEKIALRAAESVGDFYQYPMFKEGPSRNARRCGEPPITHHIIYSVATKPSNVESINDFIAAECKSTPTSSASWRCIRTIPIRRPKSNVRLAWDFEG